MKQIKRSFRELAMKLHPDRSQLSKEEAQDRFVEISEAYQILTDPNERRMYDEDRRRKTYMRRSRKFRNKHRDTSSYENVSDRNQQQRRVNPESEAKSFVEELEEALRVAYEGPTMLNQNLLSSPDNVEVKDHKKDERWFPLEFELEERSDLSDEVLCMCLGRTVLGRVYESNRPPTDSWIGIEEDKDARFIVFEYQNKVIAFAERKSCSLEIYLVQSKERLVMSNSDTNIFEDYVSSRKLGDRHRILTFRTPYMLHSHFLANGGRHPHARMVCEFINSSSLKTKTTHSRTSPPQQQRVLMPHSSLWIFPPRDERFTRASWQIQFARPVEVATNSLQDNMILNTRPGVSPAIHQTHTSIHPSVVVLVAASMICEYDETHHFDMMKTSDDRGIVFKALQATVNTFRDWAMQVLSRH